MLAFVKYGVAAGESELRDVAVPSVEPGEVLVRVSACGICGSDLHAVDASPGYRDLATPVVLGHEFAGVVARTGPDVTRLNVGDRVVAISIQGCGNCASCATGRSHLCQARSAIGLARNGGMAEYVAVAERHLLTFSAVLEPSLAAVAEPLSVAVHAVLTRAHVSVGDKVVVSGPGPVGMLCAAVANLAGAHVLLTGVAADTQVRLPMAERLGLTTADLTAHPLDWHLDRAWPADRPNVWIEAAGSTAATESALRAVRPGGAVVAVGMSPESVSLVPAEALRIELSVLFSYASTYADYRVALDLLETGALDVQPLVERFRLDAAHQAFAEARAGRVVKPVLTP